MGCGSYTANDWTMLRASKTLSAAHSTEQIFSSRTADKQYVSRNVSCRESRDCSDSPRSTPIIIGFDVTASMGYLAKELAVHAVNETVLSLLRDKPIPDPQVLCAAIGDCKSDRTPLQVTQFESDIRIIRQLTELQIEGGGGGNNGESYNLLWYFAARHTATDCFEKRKKKGYLFTIGDDISHPQLSPQEIMRVFGDSVPYAYSNREMLRDAAERYHVFHICIETGEEYQRAVFDAWRTLLPGQTAVLHKNSIGCLADLITTIISVSSGMTLNDALRLRDQTAAEQIARSMAFISCAPAMNTSTVITF